MDAEGYSIGGFPVGGTFLVLLCIIYTVTLGAYASTWSKEYSGELTGKGVYQLAIGLALIFGATGATMLLTYNFLWTSIVLVAVGIPVIACLYVVENRERRMANSEQDN